MILEKVFEIVSLVVKRDLSSGTTNRSQAYWGYKVKVVLGIIPSKVGGLIGLLKIRLSLVKVDESKHVYNCETTTVDLQSMSSSP